MRYPTLAVLLPFAFAGPALAQTASPEVVVDLNETSQKVARARDRDFVVMPIPVSNPAIGNGVAVAALALYKPGGTTQPWTTGVGGAYTDTESWFVGAFQRANFRDDRFRLTAGVGYGDANLDFYGIGADAGDRDRSIAIEQKGAFALIEASARVAPNFYIGPAFRYLDISTSLNRDDIGFPDQDIPAPELESRSSALGLTAEYDTRDSQYGPRRGLYSTAQVLRADDAFGSDFDYTRAEFTLNGYYPLSDRTVVAARLALCDVGDDTPFYDLCAFGRSNDLRGYVSGQYRDQAMAAVQMELRQDLSRRFGFVLFAGVGGVAASLDGIADERALPAAGFGLRYKASRQYGVNISVDYARGRDSDAVYFYIGEAF
jgi:outer membrane protein assembly factor BamA